MFRTKSRRNIRSKRNRSRKNRSRKNRNSRRMKGGGDPTQGGGLLKSLTDAMRSIRTNNARTTSNPSNATSDTTGELDAGKDFLDVAKAGPKNESTLCEYAKLKNELLEKRITKEDFEKKEAELMLHRIRFSDKYKFSHYPNKMSLKAIIDEHDTDLLYLYADRRMECSSSIM